MACSHAYLIAIGGGPAAGKTTLSTLLAACLHAVIAPPTRCLSLSLDDFYLAREERQRRGFKWRTLPGTHDTKRLEAFVAALDRTSHPLSVPRYDLGRDRPMQDEILAGAPGLCVFDGAMVGSRLPGYDALARRIDFFIYLEVPIRQLKAWRFQRERRIRENSGGQAGFSEAQMSDFWAEALRPSIEQWVMPNAEIADLVLKIGPNRTVLGARRQTPPREARRA
jgi:pantothenate kinase-related protein Tda10